jgi:hypothetical protein
MLEKADAEGCARGLKCNFYLPSLVRLVALGAVEWHGGKRRAAWTAALGALPENRDSVRASAWLGGQRSATWTAALGALPENGDFVRGDLS